MVALGEREGKKEVKRLLFYITCFAELPESKQGFLYLSITDVWEAGDTLC